METQFNYFYYSVSTWNYNYVPVSVFIISHHMGEWAALFYIMGSFVFSLICDLGKKRIRFHKIPFMPLLKIGPGRIGMWNRSPGDGCPKGFCS